MTVFLGAIADDFTGATDLAGLLARSGARVSLRIGVPEGPPSETAPYEVIALKIRTIPAADAVTQSEAALAWLEAAGAKQFFWKYCSTFDSTPEGNIGPVAEALMARLETKQTIYCPAFPENGRSIFMGNLFVGQQPLAESPMKDHPLTPMRDSNLMRLLAPQVTGDIGLIDRLCVERGADAVRAKLAWLTDQGIAHVVVDAVADADIEIIAQACQSFKLLTGGSALAMPLPALHSLNGNPISDPWQAPKGEALVLSGSCSEMTQRQVAVYATSAPSYKLDPLMLARNGVQPVLDWLVGQSGAPLIYATATPQDVRAIQEQLGRDRAGALVEEALAQIAVFARNKGVMRIVVAGGESSGAVTQALGVTRLDIGPEIAPGVPWCACDSDGKQMALALKSGNFGTETFFTTALQKLDSL